PQQVTQNLSDQNKKTLKSPKKAQADADADAAQALTHLQHLP
ncbi:hypothetical protein Goarm_007013, partial [Gossypium armourianum]|nr:hypothetical protein [Gossypium armourianum]